jgi:hypothetical protein
MAYLSIIFTQINYYGRVLCSISLLLFTNFAYPNEIGVFAGSSDADVHRINMATAVNTDYYKAPWEDSLPKSKQYYDIAFCKYIVNWVEKYQKRQFYNLRHQASVLEKRENLWKKTGASYSSKKFHTRARFGAASGFEEGYSDPFQGLLHRPEGEFSFSLTNGILSITNKDQIQVTCKPHPKTYKPMRPSDGATEYFGCKTGTRKGSARIEVFGDVLTIPYTISCTHATSQSSYFNVIYGDGTPVDLGKDAHDAAINRGVRPNGTRVRRNDDYAPWRQSHTQTVKFNLDEIARLNKLNKKELVARMILSPIWSLPLTTDKTKQDYFRWDLVTEESLRYGENIDHALIIFFLWKQYGITEDYLNELISKWRKEKKETIKNILLPYISSTKFKMENAINDIHKNENEGLKNYTETASILNAAYADCQREGITELVDSILNISKISPEAQIYYDTKYGITLPEYNLATCLDVLQKNIPQDKRLFFMSECRDNAFYGSRYNQAYVIAEALQPFYKNEAGTDITHDEFENCNVLVFSLLQKGSHDAALAKANEFINKYPSNTLPYEILCHIYAFQDNKKAAMEIWKKHLLKSDKKYAENHPDSRLCKLLKELGWIKGK